MEFGGEAARCGESPHGDEAEWEDDAGLHFFSESGEGTLCGERWFDDGVASGE